eukprot:CAMPEP_0118704350 /NCGR_PEP_ID=MMETSP0800-20121206/19182_1 /TAXON_ID=210618 ORGANISM="Striatella unipunctata, Strain CCMP2910" /NCGR_SAMPLE_ID=MMETSP0800 /ASSEMBLY_ACC=CAM_ASM_000638 /LENGTH=89 /DNA_ID=CAMNT_0006606221 /DNA_START=83 /DNA_END=348 /DNA_ORIENTATION=+
MWDINLSDQWRVEKKLLEKGRRNGNSDEAAVVDGESPAITRILNCYLENSTSIRYDENCEANPLTSVTRKTHREHFSPPDANDFGGEMA